MKDAKVHIYETTDKGYNTKELIKKLEKLKELIEKQLNVKKVSFKVKKKSLDDKINGAQFSIGEVELDIVTNKELDEEGFAREIMRRVQALRKESGLKKENEIELSIHIDVDLNKWKKVIMERCGAKKLEFGRSATTKFNSNGKIKEKEFVIGFNLV